MSIDFKRLAEPFADTDIEWFVGVTTSDKTKGLAIPFITNRAVQDRLDEVCGVDGWKNEYKALKESEIIDRDGVIKGKKFSYLCGISVWSAERKEWITKWDGAEDTDVEALKGGLSSAMKRAATQYGIGRYLYKLENIWVDIERKGGSYIISPSQVIVLPKWALPGGSGMPGPNESRKPTVQYMGSAGPAVKQSAPSQPAQTQKRGNLSEKQIDRAYKKGFASGQTPEQIAVWIERKFGIKDIAQLSRQQYDELCVALDQAAANVKR